MIQVQVDVMLNFSKSILMKTKTKKTKIYIVDGMRV